MDTSGEVLYRTFVLSTLATRCLQPQQKKGGATLPHPLDSPQTYYSLNC